MFPDNIYADVAELADALDLGSSGNPVQVRFLSSALVHYNIYYLKGYLGSNLTVTLF